jgi:hypothetical protein
MDATVAQMMDPNWWTGWKVFWAVIMVAFVIGIAKDLIKN